MIYIINIWEIRLTSIAHRAIIVAPLKIKNLGRKLVMFKFKAALSIQLDAGNFISLPILYKPIK
jgi:hypothetical protein